MILESFALSVCSQICTSYNDCKSAVYDDNSNSCHLYNFTEKVTTGSASGKTYIVRDGCSRAQVNVNLHIIFCSTNNLEIISFYIRNALLYIQQSVKEHYQRMYVG